MNQELPIPYQTHLLKFHEIGVDIIEPISADLKWWFEQQGSATPFPYWGKIWPSAIGLSKFIAHHAEYVSNKNILEIAAGLGLPGLVAAALAKTVTCTDYIHLPLNYLKTSATLNKFKNISTGIVDWKKQIDIDDYDTILMSDVNYNPDDFAYLIAVIEKIKVQEKTLILSTPKRLAGKDFINQILPFTRHQSTLEIISLQEQQSAEIIVLVV